MASADDIISKAETILASAKKFKGDRAERHELMKQVDLLYLELEDPMDASEILPPRLRMSTDWHA